MTSGDMWHPTSTEKGKIIRFVYNTHLEGVGSDRESKRTVYAEVKIGNKIKRIRIDNPMTF